MDKVDIKKMKSTQVMSWKKAKDMLIPEAHTFWIILKTLTAKICANNITDIYFSRKEEKVVGFKKTIKFYLWIILNLFLRIDVEPYLKSSITNKEIEDEK